MELGTCHKKYTTIIHCHFRTRWKLRLVNSAPRIRSIPKCDEMVWQMLLMFNSMPTTLLWINSHFEQFFIAFNAHLGILQLAIFVCDAMSQSHHTHTQTILCRTGRNGKSKLIWYHRKPFLFCLRAENKCVVVSLQLDLVGYSIKFHVYIACVCLHFRLQ